MLWEIGAVWLGESVRRIPPPPPLWISTKSPASFSLLLPCVPDRLNSAGRFVNANPEAVFPLEPRRAEWKEGQTPPRKVLREGGGDA